MLAREAAARLGLERVLLVPTGNAPHKEIEDDPGARVRLEMTDRAVDGDPVLSVESFEVDRASETDEPSYMVRTLEAIAAREPGAAMTLIMGADAAAGLGEWHEPEQILELASIGVAAREGAEVAQAAESVRALSEDAGVEAVDMPAVPISSTLLRERVRAGLPIAYLVPAAVERLISEHGLYAGGPA